MVYWQFVLPVEICYLKGRDVGFKAAVGEMEGLR